MRPPGFQVFILIGTQGLGDKGPGPALHGAHPAAGQVPKGPAVLAFHLQGEGVSAQGVSRNQGGFHRFTSGQIFGVGRGHRSSAGGQEIEDVMAPLGAHFMMATNWIEHCGHQAERAAKWGIRLLPRGYDWANSPG